MKKSSPATSDISADLRLELQPLNAKSEKVKPGLPSPVNAHERIGFAIVGLGHLSLEAILPAFSSSMYAKPVALVSGDAEKAATVALQYNIDASAIYSYDNFDSIRENPEIQAVFIVLPNSMHAEFTIRAAKAGKHVLCEKPMATNVSEAEQMIAACKAAGKKLMIAYRIQYDPRHHLIKEYLRSEKFGKTRVLDMFNAQNIADDDQWRLNYSLAGGGSLPDIGLYCLNTARYLTGEEPVWLNAQIFSTPGDKRFKEVEEAVFFQLRFPGGCFVNAGCSYGVHESRRYRCHGDKGGWFGVDPAFPYTGLKIETNQVIDGKEFEISPKIMEKDQFALELDHFADCISGDKDPFTPGEEGLADQRLIAAIYESAATGMPIQLHGSGGKLDLFRGSEPDYGG